MSELEQQLLRDLEGRLTAAQRQAEQAPWERRRELASRLFQAIHSAWWTRHAAAPDAHGADVARLNSILHLEGEDAQLATTASGQLLPPKFFGGDPRELEEGFVLSVTLNHAIPRTRKFADELKDFQERESSWLAQAAYFRQRYVHRVFFALREKVLAGFVAALGAPARPEALIDLNRTRTLYLEVLPTFSRRFRRGPLTDEERMALAGIFTMRLNDLARRVVLEILRPRHALLVGRAAADYLPVTPATTPHAMGRGVSTDMVITERTGVLVRVIRSRFIGRGGPRRNDELALLGQVLADDTTTPGEARVGSLPRARMVALIEEAGLGFLDKTRWTHIVDGRRRSLRHGRVMTFNNGDFIREIHLRGHTSAPDPLFELLAQSEARALHLGLVRFRLFPEKHATEDVERGVRRALVVS